jgi:PKD repeat protein
MQKNLFYFITILSFILIADNSKAQRGIQFNYSDAGENFYKTQKRFNNYFKKYTRELEKEKARAGSSNENDKALVGFKEEEELGGYELYKRWESFMAPRVYPSGDKTLASRAYEEFLKYQNTQNPDNLQGKNIDNGGNNIYSAAWQPIGPFGDPSSGNAGRINAVRFQPGNVNGLWSCAPDGGLWSSANLGGSWSTNTDFLTAIGCSDVIFDPTNPQNMFMAIGDGDAGDCYSTGVLKSTNGGLTWSATGLAWTVSQGRTIHKLLMNPQNKNTFFAATNNGLFRTQNFGVSWTAVIGAGNITDIEYKPGDTTTVYAVSTSFFKSTNGGTSFATITNGLPSAGSNNRLAIAVTPANAAYVYLIASSSANSGFLGFYQSTDNATTFSLKSSAPNVLGWASAGNDTGGQGWYTLSIAASPTNANEVVVGGVNIWRTTNQGTNWTLFAHWTGTGAPYAHADIHDLIYKNGTTVYAGTDGGVFFTGNSGASFAAVNGAMNIAQIYKIGLSKVTYSLGITGHQDNGTNLFTGGWSQTMGGDGMDCFIDQFNDQVMYGEQYNGSFNRTTNGGAAWTAITTGLTGGAAWVTPWHQDPLIANTIYAGYSQMFKSVNQGTNWSQIGTIGGGGSIVEFAVAPSNSQVIYVIRGNGLYKTTNGGTTWTTITGTLPVGSAQLTWVAVKDTDPNTVFVTFSGYSAGNKVFKSTDGGTTWINYSTGLPNLPTNCVTYWNGTSDAVYVGCDVGIYYRDAGMASWLLYNTSLPNVAVRDLAIFYPLGKIRAATYGRGVWEADLYNNGLMAPIANFMANQTVICPGMTINYTDQSAFGPTSWNWIFQSGTPATSTLQNPAIVYNTPGTFSVSLTASNANGSSVMTKTLYITVSPTNNILPLVEGFQGVAFPPTNWQNYDAGTDNLKWAKNLNVGKASSSSLYYDNYSLNCSGTRDEFRTPKYNFNNYANIKMYFDVAFARYDPTYSDTLAVMISTNCGLSYTQVYVKGGVTLATAPDQAGSIFIPTAAQWRTDTIYLNAYAGNSNVMLSFQNRGHYGQALYIDNINITGMIPGLPPAASFNYAAASPCSGQNINFTDMSSNVPNAWSWQFPGGSPATSTLANPVVNYANAGTYTVTLISSNASGSSTPIAQVITVGQSPAVTVNNPSICLGDAIVLTASGANTYSWSNGATSSTIFVSPAATTVYTVTGTIGGCQTTNTATVTVNSIPNTFANDTTICAGDAATLTASGATSYTWNTGANSANIIVSPSVSTTYTVTGFNGTCTLAAIANVSVNICAGIPKITAQIPGEILIIPNPNNGQFVLSTDIKENYSITVYNNIGQLIYFVPQAKNKIRIDLSKYGKGIYNLSLNMNGKYKNIKVAVE